MGARRQNARALLLAAVVVLTGCGTGDGQVIEAGDAPTATEATLALTRCDEPAPAPPGDEPLAADTEVAGAQRWRAAAGLRSDAAWVAEVGARPATTPEARSFPYPLTDEETALLLGREAQDRAPMQEVDAYGARFPDTFAGLWLENANSGILTVAFTDDVDERRRELEALLPDGTALSVVQGARSFAELQALQERIATSALTGQVVDATGIYTERQVVAVTVRVLDAASVRAVAEVVGPDAVGAVCVDGRTPDEVDPEGPQPGSGPGWRLLGEGRSGPVYVTLVATAPDAYADLWRASGLPSEAPPVDFDGEIVVLFGPAVSSSCPQIRLDGVVVDAGSRLVHADFAYPGQPAACTADANPHSFVVALERPTLPPSPFGVQIEEEIVSAGCLGTVPGERAEVDLSAPTTDGIAFQLVVSNQSFRTDPVDIRVEIDGRVVVDQSFAVESQHNWLRFDLVLPPGSHTVVAATTRGEARHEASFELPSRRWAVLEFWHDDGSPEQFTWRLLDEEPMFG